MTADSRVGGGFDVAVRRLGVASDSRVERGRAAAGLDSRARAAVDAAYFFKAEYASLVAPVSSLPTSSIAFRPSAEPDAIEL